MSKSPITLIAVAIAAALFIIPIAQAADIELSDTCSLADAITAANSDARVGGCPAGDGEDTITLTADIPLRAELPEISSAIVLEGANFRISGAAEHRIFFVGPDGELTINKLHLLDGKPIDCRRLDNSGTLEVDLDSACGGAILNMGMIYINDTIVSDSTSESRGGAIYNWSAGNMFLSNSTVVANSSWGGGAIYNLGEVTISSSNFSDNIGDEFGGAIWNRGSLHITNSSFSGNSSKLGSAINSDGMLSIIGSIFSNNHAFPGYHGGALYNSRGGELNIVGSSFNDNSARGGNGGAIGNQGEAKIHSSSFVRNSSEDGGAISNSVRGELSIRNSVFLYNAAANNSFGDGGAIKSSHNSSIRIANSIVFGNSADSEGGGIAIYSGEATLTHVTIARNRPGGGLYVEDEPIVRLRNSLIAGNGRDCLGSIDTYSSNFIRDGSCSPAFSGDSKLGKLVVPEDGSLPYLPLQEDSPAIDAADSLFCAETDIIGTPRPQGEGCDIGAYELPQ